MIAILHSRGQNLSLHPHLHCIIRGGGLTQAGNWIPARSDGDFLFPVKAISPVFQARFVSAQWRTIEGLDRSFYDALFKTSWVYAKRPFGGPKQVIEYPGRYTHKIAISNHRLLDITDNAVTFHYKDDALEFIGRFSLHILPKGFIRIQHYGILSRSRKQKTLPVIHEELHSVYLVPEKKEWKQISIALGFNPDSCPVCKQQTMITLFQPVLWNCCERRKSRRDGRVDGEKFICFRCRDWKRSAGIMPKWWPITAVHIPLLILIKVGNITASHGSRF